MSMRFSKILGVIGWPVAHSLSPPMQNAAIRKLQLPWFYTAFAVSPSSFQEALLGAAHLGFLGLNITLPYKEEALKYCEADELAKQVGAVNTLRFEKEKVIGTNTDVYGCIKLFEQVGLSFASEKKILVLGTGGAARAVIVALLQQGIRPIVVSRKKQTLEVFGGFFQTLLLQKEGLDPVLPDIDIIIDCTPRGLEENALFTNLYPELTLSLLPPHSIILDIAPKKETLLTKEAKKQGFFSFSGLEMLLYQGVKALEFWLQDSVPESVVREMRMVLEDFAFQT